MNAASFRAIEIEIQRQAFIELVLLVIAFAIVMYVAYRVTKAAIRDGINESRLVLRQRTWDDTLADAARGKTDLPDLRAER